MTGSQPRRRNLKTESSNRSRIWQPLSALYGICRQWSAYLPFLLGSDRLFRSRLRNLDKKVSKSKPQVDVSQFAYPLASLKEPGTAEKSLEVIDNVLEKQTGKKLATLYQDMVRECLAYIRRQSQESMATSESSANQQAFFPSVTAPSSSTASQTARRRTKKKKTRLSPGSTPLQGQQREDIAAVAEEPAAPGHVFQVSATAAETFSALFDRSSARGSVGWAEFQAAMVDLGFTIRRTFASVYTYVPPEGTELQPVSLHRPGGPSIEGHLIHRYTFILQRVYGCTKGTF